MSVDPREFNELTRAILSAAIEVHRHLGPGLLGSIYAPCLEYDLATRKLRFVRNRQVPVIYKGMEIASKYYVDLCVEDRVVVEVKSVAAILPVHEAQILTYMRLLEYPVGLLINFHVSRVMEGVRRSFNARAQSVNAH